MNEIPETKQKTTLIPDPLNIPEELRKTPQWICWRSELKESGKLNKIPIAPWRTGGEFAASVNDPANFTTFEVALRYAKEHPGVGVGFCFTQEDPYFGVDCDDCVNEAGEIDEFVRQLLAELNTYAEISPSGRGIKLIGKSREKPETSLRNDDIGLEIYTRDRFFTITGNKLPEAPGEVCQRTTQLKELLKKYRKLDIELLPGEKEENIPILKVLPPEYVKKMRRVGNHLRGPHPVHGSKTGSNFAILPEKNEWYCFRCQRGGGPLSLLAVLNGIVKCDEIGEKGVKKLGGRALERTLEIARKNGLIEKIIPGRFSEKYFDDEGRFVPQWLAEDILREMPVATHRESWVIYRYHEGQYLPDGEATIREKARELLGMANKEFFVSEVVSYIRDTTFRYPDEFEAPPELLCVENGILNVLTGEFKPHTPEIIFLHKLPVRYDPKAKCPTIILRLWEWTGDLKNLIRLVQFVGYCLYRESFIRKAFIIQGEGSNGKTTFINFLTEWLGRQNVATVKVQGMGRRFAPARLFGKLANLVDELPTEAWQDTEAFKELTGGSWIECEVKFKMPFRFCNYAKTLLAGNRLPVVADDTKAFWDRIVIIPFHNTFDVNASEEKKAENRRKIIEEMTLESEKSGFLNVALAGLKTLWQSGEFYAQEANENVRQQYIKISDPIMAFARECVRENPEGKIPKAEVYAAYVEYCQRNSFPIKENNAFARGFKRCFPRIEDTMIETQGQRIHAWRGITLVDSHDGDSSPTLNDFKSNSAQDSQDSQVFCLYSIIYENTKKEMEDFKKLLEKKLKRETCETRETRAPELSSPHPPQPITPPSSGIYSQNPNERSTQPDQKLDDPQKHLTDKSQVGKGQKAEQAEQTPVSAILSRLKELGPGTIVSPEKLATDLNLPIETVRSVIEILAQRGHVIVRGSRAVEVVV
ncbi:MAG: phage/plasmid primase, P4 family [Candidatus Hadarchaeum sp.]